MISKSKLLKQPDYLLSKYQAELFRQLSQYMDNNSLTQKQVAAKLGVSTSYINQILKGNFNFTLKKLIELSLLMGKVPRLEFVNIKDYWATQKNKRVNDKPLRSTPKTTKKSVGLSVKTNRDRKEKVQ
ncbi:helix-turn-helix domain-containing protein [Chryseolinea lacunae]|uniref:Helix-turn-helix transcriptional regulator n=1 Tax=Chryseolinea lacunae TaxID=2801331 RepID=A0ABS1KXD4_9BACT|nr:helix-turn-helix transcriptional regulator [Chryseolinea lacunae]MBL0744130.1 helix-turn-helix transcriptional regulator [Chryseolinea lacunae]